MCGLFDCIRKDVFINAGGYNVKRFQDGCGYGGEDSDAEYRIQQFGLIKQSNANVIHLHDLSCNYKLLNLFERRKLLARTYGKILVFQGFQPTFGKLLFFVRPFLAVIIFIPFFFKAGLLLFVSYLIANSWGMYTSRITLSNPRILLVPFVDFLLVYYETFWFLEGLLTKPADV